MTQNRIPFAKPCFLDEDIKGITEKIAKVLHSGWLTDGPFVQQFEEEFASFIGAENAVGLNSCTAALHATLCALGLGAGDEIIVPSDTFVATANVALYVGAKPIFVDSDPETFTISTDDIERKITKRTKAIIAVHLGGNPCDMKEIQEIAEDNKLIVIEDCAHAHGSEYEGKKCGTLGIAGCFSFYPTKVMTCVEGGIVTTDDEHLATKIRTIKNHGRSAFGPTEITELGYNYRLSDVHAAVGLEQLKHIHEYVRHRNSIAELYDHGFVKFDWISPQLVRRGNLSSYYAYIVRLNNNAPIERDELVTELRQRGIGTSVLYHPVHLQPLYVQKLGFGHECLPVAEDLGKRTVALPMHNQLSLEEAENVLESIKQIAENIPRMDVEATLRV